MVDIRHYFVFDTWPQHNARGYHMKVQLNDNSWEHLKLSADRKSAIGYDKGNQISEYPDIDQKWLQRASSKALIGKRCKESKAYSFLFYPCTDDTDDIDGT
jgi:hypothetical protein